MNRWEKRDRRLVLLYFKIRLYGLRLYPCPCVKNREAISHHLPATFSLECVVSAEHIVACRRTWQLILSGQAKGMEVHKQQCLSGIVLFFDEFYYRLFQRAQPIQEAMPSLKNRGEVLTKAVGLILRLRGDDSLGENASLARLGLLHQSYKGVRPWHFSIYSEVLLEVLLYWLGSDATIEVSEAWITLLAYALNRILRTYLIGMIDKNEYYNLKGAAKHTSTTHNRERATLRIFSPRSSQFNHDLTAATAKSGGSPRESFRSFQKRAVGSKVANFNDQSHKTISEDSDTIGTHAS